MHSLGVQIVEGKQTVCELGESFGFVKDYTEVLLMHLGRYGTIEHCFQITLDRCKR